MDQRRPCDGSERNCQQRANDAGHHGSGSQREEDGYRVQVDTLPDHDWVDDVFIAAWTAGRSQ